MRQTENISSTKLICNSLRQHSFRATKARVGLLLWLRKVGRPLSIQNIISRWEDAPNQATLYRILTDLSTAGIVRRVDLQTGSAQFEYTPDRPHHHHVVCTKCGTVEDINQCFIDVVEKKVLKNLHQFAQLDSHNLEFFGRCKQCSV